MAEALGDGIVGLRFGERAGDTPDTEDEAPAKAETPATARKPVRVSKRKAAAA